MLFLNLSHYFMIVCGLENAFKINIVCLGVFLSLLHCIECMRKLCAWERVLVCQQKICILTIDCTFYMSAKINTLQKFRLQLKWPKWWSSSILFTGCSFYAFLMTIDFFCVRMENVFIHKKNTSQVEHVQMMKSKIVVGV